MSRSKYFVVVAVIGILVLSTVTALVVTALTAEKISLFGGSIQDTDFSVSGIETQFKGKNKVVIDIIFVNSDTAGHSANISVQLLDVSGELLIEDSVLSGVVAPSGTYSYSHDFISNNLVANYDSTQIIIKQID